MYYEIPKNAIIQNSTYQYPKININSADKIPVFDNVTDYGGGFWSNTKTYLRPLLREYIFGSQYWCPDVDAPPLHNLTCSLIKTKYTTNVDVSITSAIRRLSNTYYTYNPNYKYDMCSPYLVSLYGAPIYNATNNDYILVQITKQLFGTEICSGTFKITDNNTGRMYADDGRGLLLTSGSQVGKVWYRYGVALISASANVTEFDSCTNYDVELLGKVLKTGVVINIPIQKQQAVCSTNPSYFRESGANNGLRTRILDSQKVFFDTVYLYNNKREMVGIAKIAQPAKKTYNESYIVRIKYTY